MGGYKLAALSLMLLMAPLAAAGDPFQEEACVGDTACAGPGTCTLAGCVPRSCQPVVTCRGDVGPGTSACAVNLTIDGRTCQTHLGAGAEDAQPVTLPGWGDASTGLWVGAQVSDGQVDSHNLPNSWLSPGADADVRILGVDGGSVSAGAYRSEILTEGPRSGPYGQVSPSQNQTWTEIGVFVRHSHEGAEGEDVVVTVWLLDLVPDGCFARSPSGQFSEFECPKPHALLP